MKAKSMIKPKRSAKEKREKNVLLGVIEYYVKTGKAVGSNTLREEGFEKISSATIRNYFADLEAQGFLHQQHASGGRIPTEKAFKFYADEICNFEDASEQQKNIFKGIENWQSKEINPLLELTAELISESLGVAVFLSSPRFDHDFIVNIKLISIDAYRLLAVIITDFGVVRSEILYTENKLSSFSIKRIEEYFNFRMTGLCKPENMTADEEKLAITLYNELMVRYVIAYSCFEDEDIYRTGFSRLFAHSDFASTTTLAESMALFESSHSLRLLLKESTKTNQLCYWIGKDLIQHTKINPECMVVTCPYYVSSMAVGSIGVLGPIRMPYKAVFAGLKFAAKKLSKALTSNLYKFKITLRQPEEKRRPIQEDEKILLEKANLKLLEDKTKK